VRESRTLGSVGAKAEWLSYPTNSHPGITQELVNASHPALPNVTVSALTIGEQKEQSEVAAAQQRETPV